jgi:hypothetical protein
MPTDTKCKPLYKQFNCSETTSKTERLYIKLIKEWMNRKNVEWIQIRKGMVYAFEPINKMDRDVYIREWLNNNISTRKFKAFLRKKKWCVGYFLKDFMERLLDD